MADPISAAIAAVVKIGAAIVTAYKASMVVRIVIHIAAALAIGMVAAAFAAKPGKINQGQELSLKLDPTMPRQVAVGRIATGGSQAWAFTYGTNGDVPNRYLVRILALSDRPASGLVKIQEGGEVLTFSGDPTTGLVPCTTHVNKKGQPCLHVQVVLGSDAPTGNEASWLFAASNNLWTNKHKYTGGCYAIIRSDYDPDAFPNGEPQLVFVLDGAKVEDPRNGTVAFSRNAALITHQLLKGFYTNGSLIVGSEAKDYDFQPGYVAAAANLCDEAVPIGPEWGQGATEPRYRAGMLLTASEPTSSALQDLKNAMDGKIYDRSGRIAILPGAVRTPVLHITDENLDWSAPKSLQPYSSLQSLYNQVNGAYVSEALGFEQVAFPIQKDPAYVIQDGGERIILSQDFRAVNSDIQIQRITKRILKASRFQKLIAFTGPTALYELQQGDWFTMDSARWNLATKYFECLLVTLNEDLRVTIVALETSPVIDGWSTADEVPRSSTGYIPPPYKMPVPILAVTSTSVTQTIDGVQTALPVIDIVVTVPDGSPVSGYKIEYRLATQAITTRELPMSIRDTNTLRISGDLMPGAFYEVRAAGYDGDRTGDWSNWEVVQVSNVFTVPDSGGMGGINWQDWWDELLTAGAIDILPSIPTEEIPGKPVIYNDSDGKLYRWDPAQNKYVKEVDGGDIAQGTLDNLAFVADLQVPGLGNALPALPDTKWPEGSMFVNTADGKTYTNRGGSWSASIDATDIIGTVPSGIPYGPTNPATGSPDQLFHNTTDGKLYRWTGSGWTAEVASADIIGQLIANQIANAAIEASKLATGAVTTPAIAAGAITASKMFVGDFSNLIPDPQMVEASNWTTYSGWTFVPSGAPAGFRSVGYFQSDADSGTTGSARSGFFTVEEGSQYYFAVQVDGSPNGASNLRISYRDANNTETQVTIAPITSAGEAASITTVPAGMKTAQITITYNGSNAIKIGGFVARRAASGQLIVDGAITTDKLSANAVTAGKIAAGSITTDKIVAGSITTALLGAGAVTASKLFVGDTSNMFPDPNMTDRDAWNDPVNTNFGTNWNLLPSGTADSTSINYLRINSNAANISVVGPLMYVEPGKEYFWSSAVRFTSTDNAGWDIYARYYTVVNGVPTYSTLTSIASSATGSTTRQVVSGQIVIPAGITGLSIQFRRRASTGIGVATFDSPITRRAASGELIVDGAITTDKLAANSVVAGKIAAGAITASAIAAAAITSSKLYIGDLSNLVDGKFFDTAGWTGGVSNFQFLIGVNLDDNQRVAAYNTTHSGGAANAYLQAAYFPAFAVEGGKEYTFGGKARSYANASGRNDLDVWWDDANGVNISNQLVARFDTNGSSATRDFSTTLVAPANATSARIRIRIVSDASGGYTPQIRWRDIYARKSTSGELVVDGAITAVKLAANSVTADKIVAGAVTAAKISVSVLSAISANLGSITAGSINIGGLFIVSTTGVVTIKSSTGTSRTEVIGGTTKVWNNGVLRVQLGDMSI